MELGQNSVICHLTQRYETKCCVSHLVNHLLGTANHPRKQLWLIDALLQYLLHEVIEETIVTEEACSQEIMEDEEQTREE